MPYLALTMGIAFNNILPLHFMKMKFSFNNDILAKQLQIKHIDWLGKRHVTLPGVSKNTRRLIWSKLKRTVFIQLAFIFSESSYLNLKFGIKQSKIGWKFAQEWLTKAKISGLTDDREPDVFEKCSNLKQSYCFIKVRWSVKISWNWKRHNCFT